jgi:hypothetical protein
MYKHSFTPFTANNTNFGCTLLAPIATSFHEFRMAGSLNRGEAIPGKCKFKDSLQFPQMKHILAARTKAVRLVSVSKVSSILLATAAATMRYSNALVKYHCRLWLGAGVEIE